MNRFKILLISFSCMLCTQGWTQLTKRCHELRESVSKFTYSNQYDSAQVLALKFLDLDDLSPIETFYGNFLFGDIVKSSGQADKAIRILTDVKKYLKKIPQRAVFESLLLGNLAECHFTLQDYKKAREFALKAIKASPDTSLRGGGHAVNMIIIGYSDYLNKNYASSIRYYQDAASQYVTLNEDCELPLCYTKMAKTYNALGNPHMAQVYINKSLAKSDSCNIESYTLLSRRTQFDIYRENNEHEKALATLMEINILVEKAERSRQSQVMDEMIARYNNLLVEKENESLRKVNDKNEEVLSNQRQILIISIIAAVTLLVLTFFLIYLARQRKKAEQKLVIINNALEQIVASRTAHLTEANRKNKEATDLVIFQNKQLTDFCNIISHNLRSPLVNMGMLVDFIEKSKTDEEKKQFINKLKPVIDNLNETFNELIESLQVRQDAEIKSYANNLNECLNRTIKGLQAKIISSDATIEADFHEAEEIMFPTQYLHSIFDNLIGNALKYQSPDRKPIIKLKTTRTKNSIILEVRDNGLGIDLNKHGNDLFKIRKIFHPHPEAKGFGLYITKTQVEAMNGKIWAESNPGKGTSFFVEFVNQ